MNTYEWTEFTKFIGGSWHPTNDVYVAIVSPDKDILCMDFGHPRVTSHNDFFFKRELEYLDRFKNKSWAPEVLKIDIELKQIFIKWYQDSCNSIIYSGNNLDEACPQWREQLGAIVRDVLSEGVYKMTLYPHCFYIDNDQNLRTIDFYACVDKDKPAISFDTIGHIMSKKSAHRWIEAQTGDVINFEVFFNRAIETHITDWPNTTIKELI
jgi:hypothetical protein